MNIVQLWLSTAVSSRSILTSHLACRRRSSFQRPMANSAQAIKVSLPKVPLAKWGRGFTSSQQRP